MQLPPTLQFVPETRTFGNFSIDVGADFWNTLIFRLFFGITTGTLIQQARAVLEDTVNTWFESWKRTQPNIRNAQVAYDGISIQRITTSYFFGLITTSKYRISTVNLHVTYERGELVSQTAQVRPAPVTVDPPPFAFKLPPTFTLEGIQGRVIIEGGDSFETGGDTLIVHNGAGLAASGLLTNRAVPRTVQVGQDANGAPIYQLDPEAIVDNYVSLEGLGLNIPVEGFTGRDAVKTFGVLGEGRREHGLAARRRAAAAVTGGADLTRRQLHRLAARPARLVAPQRHHPRHLTGNDVQHIALQIVLGDGNDSVYLKQTTGNVTVLGGRGNDTLTVSSTGQSLGQIGGEVRFDGAAHIDETTHQVASLTELGLPSNLALPSLFVNTANPTLSFVDAGGRTIRYSNATLQPIVFQGANGLMVNAVVLRSDGEIVTDLVREQGVQEKGVVEQGKQKWDADDNPLWLREDFSVTTVNTGVPVIVSPGAAVNADPTVKYVCINGDGNRVLSATSSCTGMRPSIVTAMTDPNAQLVYLDGQGNKTFSSTGANNFPNRKSFVTDYTGAPLFVDTHGLRTDVPPTTLVVDNAGADITIYAQASGSVSFGAITVEVSANGTTWKAATAVATAVRIPGDGGHPIGYVKSYDIGDNNGTLYKYVRVSGSSTDFRLDAIGIVPGHGGPENSSLETASRPSSSPR